MQLTVKEIIRMLDNHELHYDHTTQRQFVYNTIMTHIKNPLTDTEVTKAGAVINSILEEHIQLPAVYFWKNNNTEELNIHDGKQRLLSIYYFYKDEVMTYLNGKSYNYSSLPYDLQQKLLNYTIDIVERTGTKEEEETSFFLINTNALPLTNYECLKGMYYGSWLTGFEQYIDERSKSDKGINTVGRGEQAYKILLHLFVDDMKNSNSLQIIKKQLQYMRNLPFNPTTHKIDLLLDFFCSLNEIQGLKISEDIALGISKFMINENYIEQKSDLILRLYQKSIKTANDINKWKLDIHQTFIKAKICKNLELDPLRFFSDKDKTDLFNQKKNWILPYKKLEVDHFYPWSYGGKTDITNAQLLAKENNSSKKDAIPEKLEHELSYYLYQPQA